MGGNHIQDMRRCYPVQKVQVHPKFDRSIMLHDIATLTLKSPINFQSLGKYMVSLSFYLKNLIIFSHLFLINV